MIGYPTVVFETSSTSGFHESWSATESTESAITLVLRLSHSSLSWPTLPSSVVRAVKSGALSPRCREAMDSLQSLRARVVPVCRQYPVYLGLRGVTADLPSGTPQTRNIPHGVYYRPIVRAPSRRVKAGRLEVGRAWPTTFDHREQEEHASGKIDVNRACADPSGERPRPSQLDGAPALCGGWLQCHFRPADRDSNGADPVSY